MRFLKPLFRNLRSRFLQRQRRIWVLEPAARLALLKLDARALARADAHAGSACATADGTTGAASRATVRVVDATAYGELSALALADGGGACVDGRHVATVLPDF